MKHNMMMKFPSLPKKVQLLWSRRKKKVPNQEHARCETWVNFK